MNGTRQQQQVHLSKHNQPQLQFGKFRIASTNGTRTDSRKMVTTLRWAR
jgi:hypothetical protein